MLYMEWLGGTEISWFWTKCTCKVTKLPETQYFLYPSQEKLNLSCSEVLKWLQSDPTQDQKLNLSCSEVLKWLQLDPPKIWSWTWATVKFWSDCSWSPPGSEVELELQWSSEVTAVRPPPNWSEVELELQWSSEVTAVGPPHQSEVELELQWSYEVTAVRPPPPLKWGWTWAAVKFWSDCSWTPPPPTKVRLNLSCSEVMKWLQLDPPTEVRLNLSCSEVLKWLQSDPPGTLHDCNFRILNI